MKLRLLKILIRGVFYLLPALFFTTSVFAEITINGIPDETEWASAQSFRDFVVINPLTLETPRLATETKVLSLPEGLAVAFICEQPPEEARTRTQTLLDAARFDSDSVSLMIDFDGTGKIAYEFSVSITGSYRDGTITDETRFNYDWDGVWEQAVSETPETWTVEMLLPWSIATMRNGHGDTRTIGVSFQRVLNSRNEKYAYPDATPDRGRFISNFAPIKVSKYNVQEVDIWPYVTMLNDLVDDETTIKAGIDLFWKRNGNLQVSGTVNPDFGQVESDDLVINFSAIETLFSEKRPFFTENQAIFKLGSPRSGNLIYTRRIGGPNDKDGTPADIDGAVKVIGSQGKLDYGLMAAWEADEEGRNFYAGRLLFPAESYSVGTMTSYTDRPFLEREALVNVIDFDIKAGDALRMEGKLLSSSIDSPLENDTGFGAYCNFAYNPSEKWNTQAVLTYYGDKLDVSDMGYIARTDLVEIYMSGQLRKTDFADTSHTASVSWRMTSIVGRNTGGDRLPTVFSLNRTQSFRSGSSLSAIIGLESSGYDDLLSRGNGLVYLNGRWNASVSYTTQRKGAWRQQQSIEFFQEGYEDWAAGIRSNVTWYPLDDLTVDFTINPQWSRDWLIWLHDTLLAGFKKRQLSGNILATWFPAEKHEFRLKTQWVALKADSAQGYRIGDGGELIAVDETIDNFANTKFGFQLRYRYKIAPLSDFYIVYSRGGMETIENPDESTVELFKSSTNLRDSDQILLKVSYRF